MVAAEATAPPHQRALLICLSQVLQQEEERFVRINADLGTWFYQKQDWIWILVTLK